MNPDDVPAVIIKNEVMINEDAIVSDQEMIVDEHRGDLGTPSSFLTSTHQPEVKIEAGTRHEGPAVIFKGEVIIEEETILPYQEMIVDDHEEDKGTPSSFLTSTHQREVKTEAGTLRGEKPFACDRCDYRTGHRSYLKLHMKIHAGEKPFACDYCDYRGGQIRYLKRHMRTHTGEKPFACVSCEYRADYFSYLKRHMRTHTGEKPFACHRCDYRAGQLVHLRKHLSAHNRR